MGRAAVGIELSAAERRELQSLARAQKTGQAMARRARIVLAAAAGLENKAIRAEVGADANTVSKWRRRFAAHRLDGLLDEPRPGTPRKIGDGEIADTIRLTLEATPPGTTHWSLRSMAKAVGYAPSTIHRIWRAFGLQPHRTEAFKLSNDPLFVEKVRDIAGLYLAPPERALVLCVDEKSQIQALDRSQPLLPMRPAGHASATAARDRRRGAVPRSRPRHRRPDLACAPDGLRVGEAITRSVRMEAEDTAAMLLPPALWGAPNGFVVYPDPPVLQDRTDRGVLRALRVERAAFVPQRSGALELPGFALDWLDPRSGQVREVRVDAVRVAAVPAGNDPERGAPSRTPWLRTAAAVAVVLPLAAGLALLAWRRLGRRPRPGDAASDDAFAALAAACRADDARSAMAALFRWCDAAMPRGADRGIARLAATMRTPDLAAEARALEAHLYGARPDGGWTGGALLAAARRARRRLHPPRRSRTEAALPDLNPGAASAAPPPRVLLRNWAR